MCTLKNGPTEQWVFVQLDLLVLVCPWKRWQLMLAYCTKGIGNGCLSTSQFVPYRPWCVVVNRGMVVCGACRSGARGAYRKHIPAGHAWQRWAGSAQEGAHLRD